MADTKPAARLTITASGEYNNPNTPMDSITFEIEAHMKAYGFQDIKVTVGKAVLSLEATAQLCARVYQLEDIKTSMESALAYWPTYCRFCGRRLFVDTGIEHGGFYGGFYCGRDDCKNLQFKVRESDPPDHDMGQRAQ